MNLTLSNISKKFGKTEVLKNLHLEINQGEIVAILGGSGSGKSTLLNIIAGFDFGDTGTVNVANNIVFNKENNIFIQPEIRKIGYVFQNFSLFPHMTVYDNIAFGIEKKYHKTAVTELLDFVNLPGYEKRFPDELSGGQQQRIALARALATKPELLLLDEPFSGLDASLRTSTREEVRKILENTNTTTILVTHDQEEAFAIADRVAILNNGVVEQIDTAYNIYNLPATKFIANFVGIANFIDGFVDENKITTEIGIFDNPTYLRKKTPVKVMIRPENISISLDENGTTEVIKMFFKGSDNYYDLKLSSGAVIHCRTNSNFIIEAGTKVCVTARLDNTIIFNTDKEERIV